MKSDLRKISDDDLEEMIRSQVAGETPSVSDISDISEDQLNQMIAEQEAQQPEGSYLGNLVGRQFLGQGAAMGFGDEIEGGVRSLWNGSSYEDERDAVRRENELFEAQNGKSAIAAQLAGGMVMPGGLAVNAGRAGIKQAMGQGAKWGAITGAVDGVGTSVEESIPGMLEDAAVSAGAGGVLGGALGGAGHKISEAAGHYLRPTGRADRILEEAIEDVPDAEGVLRDLGPRNTMVANISDKGGEKATAIARTGVEPGFVKRTLKEQREGVLDEISPDRNADRFATHNALDKKMSKRVSALYEKATGSGEVVVVGGPKSKITSSLKELSKINAKKPRALYKDILEIVKDHGGITGPKTIEEADSLLKALQYSRPNPAADGSNARLIALYDGITSGLRKDISKNPGYKKAVKLAASRFAANEASSFAQKIVSGTPRGELNELIEKNGGDAAREALADYLPGVIVDVLDKNSLGQLKKPATLKKILDVLGPIEGGKLNKHIVKLTRTTDDRMSIEGGSNTAQHANMAEQAKHYAPALAGQAATLGGLGAGAYWAGMSPELIVPMLLGSGAGMRKMMNRSNSQAIRRLMSSGDAAVAEVLNAGPRRARRDARSNLFGSGAQAFGTSLSGLLDDEYKQIPPTTIDVELPLRIKP